MISFHTWLEQQLTEQNQLSSCPFCISILTPWVGNPVVQDISMPCYFVLFYMGLNCTFLRSECHLKVWLFVSAQMETHLPLLVKDSFLGFASSSVLFCRSLWFPSCWVCQPWLWWQNRIDASVIYIISFTYTHLISSD